VNFNFEWILLFCVQVCWLWKKVKSAGPQSFQRFLDTVQYTSTGILRYERIFGEGYVSTGGFGKFETVDMSWLRAGTSKGCWMLAEFAAFVDLTNCDFPSPIFCQRHSDML
jgi:hypothetical protein